VCFYLVWVYQVSVYVWLYQDRYKSIFRNRQDGSDVGIGRDDDLIPLTHHTHLFVRSKDKDKRIQTVGYTYGVFGSAILGELFLKSFTLTALDIPTAIYHSSTRFDEFRTILGIDAF
jgi:hypothetical protein